MTRLKTAFARAKEDNRAALVIYLCAGDPDVATTERLILAAADAGADVIEVGVPFSDPTADGPVIQRASERALKHGTSLTDVLGVVKRVRAKSEVAIVLFGYYNPILSHGEAQVAKAAKEAGADGFLVVDLPPEEADSFVKHLHAQQLDFVPLVAPTTPDDRVTKIASLASSFIYYVSITGVTGAKAADFGAAAKRANEVQAKTGLPVVVGFGVKTPSDARQLHHAAGLVVGSAICQLIEDAKSSDEAVSSVNKLVRELHAATSR
jgi:tryptophan synthase alpha chain